jgi:hypothetical protein
MQVTTPEADGSPPLGEDTAMAGRGRAAKLSALRAGRTADRVAQQVHRPRLTPHKGWHVGVTVIAAGRP